MIGAPKIARFHVRVAGVVVGRHWSLDAARRSAVQLAVGLAAEPPSSRFAVEVWDRSRRVAEFLPSAGGFERLLTETEEGNS